jgi:hypothetical protein
MIYWGKNPTVFSPLPSPPPCTISAFLLTKNKWHNLRARVIAGNYFSLTNQMYFIIYNLQLPIKTSIQNILFISLPKKS